jgi:hypothetical protein
MDTAFEFGNRKGERVVGRTERRWRLNLEEKEFEWIHVVQDGVHWRALVNTAVDFQVPLKRRIC